MKRAVVVAIFVAIGAPGCAGPPGGPVVEVGQTWNLEAVDSNGHLGRITVERGEVVPLPAWWVAADIGRSHAILVHVAYDLERPAADGHGTIDWHYTSPVDAQPLIFDEPARNLLDGMPHAADTLGVFGPGGNEEGDGWVMLTVGRPHLNDSITLTYQPSGEELVIHVP